MCIFNLHKPKFQPTYRPIEAALLWCGLQEHREYILNSAWGAPGQFIRCLRHWPELDRRFNKIMDAITHNDLPSEYCGFQIPLTVTDNGMHLRVRHVELQRWMVRYYPDHRPVFLFNSGPSCPFSDELCSTLLRRIDLLNSRHLSSIEEVRRIKAELNTANQQIVALEAKLTNASSPNQKRRSNYERTIAVLIELLLKRNSESGHNSPLKTQESIISLIETHYSNIQGLSKRALEKRFAESLRTLNEYL